MLGTLVAVQAGQSLSTDGVGRDHALDSVGHGQIAVLSHQLAVLDLLQAANVLAVGDVELLDRKSTRLNSSHIPLSRMPSSA